MRPLLTLIVLLLATAPVLLMRRIAPDVTLRARAIPLDARDPARTRVGRLRYLGGWALASRDPRFGGFSALVADGRGGVVAVADSGMAARFAVGAGVRLVGLVPLPVPASGDSLKAARDAESATRDPATGRVWIGYEGSNRIARHDAGLTRLEASAAPAAMADWPTNGGAETLARLADGRFLVISETGRTPDGARRALLFPGDPADPATAAPVRFGYRPPPGYDPSDATRLPDGRVLVLNRRVAVPEGFSAILVLLDPRAIRAGATLSGVPVARLARPLAIDNLEGMAATVEAGRTVLWLISDDNFLPFERTLLLRFALDRLRLD